METVDNRILSGATPLHTLSFLHSVRVDCGGFGREKSGEKGKEKSRKKKGKYPPFFPPDTNVEKEGLSTGKGGKDQFRISSIILVTNAANSGSVAIAASTFRNAAIMVA